MAWLGGRGVAWGDENGSARSQRWLGRLADTGGVIVHAPRDPAKRLGVVSCTFEHLSPTEACGILANKFGINVRCGLHCSPLTHRRIGTDRTGTLRFSVGVFTTFADVDAAADAMKQISDTLYRRGRAA